MKHYCLICHRWFWTRWGSRHHVKRSGATCNGGWGYVVAPTGANQ